MILLCIVLDEGGGMKSKFVKISLALIAFVVLSAGLVLGINQTNLARTQANVAIASSGVDGDGHGTEAEPFLVGTAATLRAVLSGSGTAVAPRHVFIINGFSYAGQTTIAGTINHIVLNGNNHEITGVNNPIFSILANSTIRNFSFSGSGNIAQTIQSTTLDNVHRMSGHIATGLTGVAGTGVAVGGLAHQAVNATILNSSNRGSVGRTASGTNGGLIGVADGDTLRISRSWNEGHITGNQFEVSGGLVGFFRGTGTGANASFIEQSFNIGNVGSNRSAGILGRFLASGVLTIRETYNTGNIINVPASNTIAAGIVAWAGSTGILNIETSFNTGTIQGSTSGGGSGIFAYRSGATINISNTFNIGPVQQGIAHHSDRTGVNITNSFVRTNSTNIVSGGQFRTEQQISDFFVDNLPSVFMRHPNDPNGHPVLINNNPYSAQYHTVTFDPNGGTFGGLNGDLPISFDVRNETSMYDANETVVNPIRTGWTFLGWAEVGGDVLQFADIENLTITEGITYLARWETVTYAINIDNSGNIAEQIDTFATGGITSRTIGQQLTLNAQLSDDTFLGIFAGFQVNNGTNWINLGTGVERPGIVGGYGLTVTIDEDFINNFAQGTNFTFRAVYTEGSTADLTVSITNPGFGRVEIDNITRHDGNIIRYTQTGTVPVRITVPAHRTLVSVTPSGAGTTTALVPNTTDTRLEQIYTFTLNINTLNTLGLNIEFGTQQYNVNITGITVNDDPVTLTPFPNQIGLGANFTPYTIEQIQDHRLVSPTSRNIRVYSPTDGWVYFNATNGVIHNATFNLTHGGINTAFLTRFADENGDITIEVIFVKLFYFDVTVVGGTDLGDVRISVANRDGRVVLRPTSISELTALATTPFEEDSTFTVTLLPNNNAAVGAAHRVLPWSLDTWGIAERTFTLDQNFLGSDAIQVSFEEVGFSVHAAIRDAFENELEFETGNVSLTVSDANIANGDTLTIEIENFDNVPAAYELLGWKIVNGDRIGGIATRDLSELGWEAIAGLSNLDGDIWRLEVDVDSELIENWITADGRLQIFAVFALRLSVNVDVNIAGSGTYSTELLEGLELEDGSFVGGSELRITFTPSAHFAFSGVIGGLTDADGEIENENGTYSIVIIVNGIREITINFERIQYTIIPNHNVSNDSVATSTPSLSIGQPVTITFSPRAGFQVRSWSINGESIEALESRGLLTISSSNTVVLRPDEAWLTQHGGRLACTIRTSLNRLILAGIIAAAILIPLLVVAIVMLVAANNKRKEDYAKALQKQKASEFGLNQSEFYKNLREGEGQQ